MSARTLAVTAVFLLGLTLTGCGAQPAPLPATPAIPATAAVADDPTATAEILPTATAVPAPATPTPVPTIAAQAALSTATPENPSADATPPMPSPSPAPSAPSLSEVPVTNGPVRTTIMESRDHFPVQLGIQDFETGGYNTVPPTSGMHWSAWSDCGFYNYPLPDELLVHNLEHGNIIVSYNLTDEAQISALRDVIDGIPFAAEYAVVRRYHGIPEGMVAMTTWGVLDRMLGVDSERIARFFDEFPGNTGPEFPNGLPCTTGVQMTDSSGG